ncbi:MAG: hypothetical protein ABR552_08290 [Actinomycetota bacterium]
MTTVAPVARRVDVVEPGRTRGIPSATVAGLSVGLAIVAKGLQARISDPDLWWHLRAGQLIVARHSIPAGDPFSYTLPGHRWIAQEWLSEVLMRSVAAMGGLQGVIVWRALMLCAAYALVARMMVRARGSSLSTWALFGLSAFAGVQSWTERPSVFSFLLFTVTLSLVYARDRRIWWFVPIALVWVNLHGMVLVGLGLVGLVSAVELLAGDRAWGRHAAGATACALVAVLINPYGPGAMMHALSLVRTVRPFVTEWAPPSVTDPVHWLFFCLVAFTLVTLARARPRWPDVAVAAAFAALGFMAVRNLPVAAIALGTVSARALPPGRPSAGRVQPVVLLAVIAVFGVVIAGSVGPARSPSLPVAAVRALPGGDVRLFTRDAWAGFALYERHNVRVTFDTRVDFYGAEATRAYQRALAGLDGWRTELRCATHALVADGDGLASRLSRDPSWSVVLHDPTGATLFVARAPSPSCA